ncbi:MAG: hypothetical protein WCP45_13420 [Verrucomicrobiota bacterium]
MNDARNPNRGRRCRMLAAVLVIISALSACEKKRPAAPAAAPSNTATAARSVPLARQLAAARLDTAKSSLANHSQDAALALLVSALKADPTFTEAEALMRQLLTETVWHVPCLAIQHQMPVEHLAFVPPAALWVSLAETREDGFNTTVLWDTDTVKIQSVLFPARGVATRSLVVGPNPHAIVLQRGSGPTAVTLLCDAKSLRPIRDLGPLPENLTPQSVVASAANGLLIAHPGPASATDKQLVWRIRDAATGEVIRSSDPVAGSAAVRPLAAQLDTRRLRVLQTDGSLLDLPVSPVEPARGYISAMPLALWHAQFNPDGRGALALLDQGPDHPPVRQFYQISDPPEDATPGIGVATATHSIDPLSTPWLGGLPWSRQPSVWTGLLRDHGNPQDPSPIRVEENELRFCVAPRAPLHAEAPISAVAFGPGRALIGMTNGGVTLHRFLPLPAVLQAQDSGRIDPAAMVPLAEILSGTRFDEVTGTFLQLTARQRLFLLEKLPPGSAAGVLPGLDFSATLADLKASQPREAPAACLLPLWDRLARSDQSGTAWPRLLELARSLGDSSWHQDLTEAAALRASPRSGTPAARGDDPSPWLAQLRLREVFATGEATAILTAVEAAGGKGPAAATALALALDGEHPEWIEACVKSATDLPALLRLLGNSRVAWLQQRRADALAMWPDELPDYGKIRLTEDWDGWEQEDFSTRFEAHLQVVKEALASYEITADATPAERAAVAARLLDPAARDVIGRRRLTDGCLKAALTLAAFPENSAATFQLANRARTLGAQPEPCLRAEALALTRLGDYANAHPRWITLLTEHPVATHLSGDYAEAAYTAFETGDPNQALQILTSGIKRFPNDAGYALRAGWTALLTTHFGPAYQFLLAGLRIGYPDDKRENACLLLSVAAAQAGFPEEAATHYQNLLEIAPAWAEAKTIDALEWPEELKACLHALAR